MEKNKEIIGTKGDEYTKELLQKILDEGCMDKNPRPHYEDIYKNAVYDKRTNTIITENNDVVELKENQKATQYKDKVILETPAHTISVNNPGLYKYDLSKGDSPMITLRPVATKAAIAEILWIYQKASTDLVEFDKLLGRNTWDNDHKINNWWEDWALKDEKGEYLLNEKGHPHIGSTYGNIINKYHLVENKLKEMKDNPDSRYHIISMWQYEMFEHPHGLKPCAFQTMWNIRHGRDGNDYLDMKLVQRSSDFATAGCINQVQYATLLILFARHLGLEPGVFTWDPTNVQIYDRHIDQAKEIITREPIECNPKIIVDNPSNNFYDVEPDNIKITDIPRQKIKEKNPQLQFQLGI